jgi:hypothetical protein
MKEYDVYTTHYLQVSQVNVNLPNYELFNDSKCGPFFDSMIWY